MLFNTDVHVTATRLAGRQAPRGTLDLKPTRGWYPSSVCSAWDDGWTDGQTEGKINALAD